MKRSFYLSLPLLDFLALFFHRIICFFGRGTARQEPESDLGLRSDLPLYSPSFNLSLSFHQQRYVAPSPIQIQQRETLEKAMALARDHALKRSTMTNMAGQLSQRTAEKLSESSWKRTIAESLGKR